MSLRGKLLVATPGLRDPNFYRTVVFLIAHTDEGAAGVVINRPSETRVDQALPAWASATADPPVVFVGGPVQPSGAVCLARARDAGAAEAFEEVSGGVGSLDLAREPAEVLPGMESIRLFVGYSGWESGQLEREIAAGAWFVVDSDPRDALTDNPESLWRRVLRRQRGRLALFSTFPDDPRTN